MLRSIITLITNNKFTSVIFSSRQPFRLFEQRNELRVIKQILARPQRSVITNETKMLFKPVSHSFIYIIIKFRVNLIPQESSHL